MNDNPFLMFHKLCSLLLQDVIFQWLTTDDIQLNNIDAEDPEVLYFDINPEISVSPGDRRKLPASRAGRAGYSSK